MKRKCFVTLASAFISISLSSCQDKSYVEVPVYPTSGTIRVGGEPAYGAYLTLHPDGDIGITKGNKPFGRVAKDGTFQVTTYDTNDGAPAGQYRVTVIWPEDPEARGPSPDRLKGKYADPKSTPLRAKVEAAKGELPPFELQSGDPGQVLRS